MRKNGIYPEFYSELKWHTVRAIGEFKKIIVFS